jgi:hypothetical protein
MNHRLSLVRHLMGATLAAGLGLASVTTWAQTAEFQEQGNSLKYSATPVSKLVLANAQVKVGVSLERLSLISGEGHEDKKITAGLMAGAMILLNMKSGGRGVGMDFAEREPIEDHLKRDDATLISQEAVAIIMDKLRAAGLPVDGPDKVVSAPFYADVKGEAEVTQDTASQDGGLFKKSYYYGFYCLPVSGLKYRKPGMFEGMGNDDLYPKARAAAGGTGGALDVNLAFYNDKKVFGLFDMGLRIWGQVQGRSSDMPMLMQVLKNKDDFTVPSGGKDAYTYWLAFKPKFEAIAVALADRVVKALPAP